MKASAPAENANGMSQDCRRCPRTACLDSDPVGRIEQGCPVSVGGASQRRRHLDDQITALAGLAGTHLLLARGNAWMIRSNPGQLCTAGVRPRQRVVMCANAGGHSSKCARALGYCHRGENDDRRYG